MSLRECLEMCVEDHGGWMLAECAHECAGLLPRGPGTLAELARYACERGEVTAEEAARRFGWRTSTARKYLALLAREGLLARVRRGGATVYVCAGPGPA